MKKMSAMKKMGDMPKSKMKGMMPKSEMMMPEMHDPLEHAEKKSVKALIKSNHRK